MDDGSLDHYSNNAGVENWPYSGHILRVKLIEFSDGFDKGVWEKAGSESKVTPKVLAHEGTKLTFIEIEENWESGNRIEEEEMKTCWGRDVDYADNQDCERGEGT